jgi:hypothetical protein
VIELCLSNAGLRRLVISAMPMMKNGAIVVSALLLVSIVVLISGHKLESPIPFTSEVWKHQEDSNERLRMISVPRIRL